MSAVVLLVTLLAPAAVLMQHWRRPKPARIAYPRTSAQRGRHVR